MPCQCADCTARREGNAPVDTCADCGHPYDDCTCATCSNCGDRIDAGSECSDCGRGSCCCRCDANEPPYCDPAGTFHGTPSPRYPRYLGIEIECFANRVKRREYRALATTWGAGITSDGSIRSEGGAFGIEHVTAPARGDAFLAQLHATCEMLSAQGAKVNKSCGLHVHVDARDFTISDILAFARLYSRVEKSLYGLVSKARRTNDYSRPWGDSLDKAHRTSEGTLSAMDDSKPITAREKALDVATYGSEDQARHCKRHHYKDSSRYHGVNFNALAIHGTIEFRLHHGTTNETKIAMWAAVCSAMVEFAKNHGEEAIKALRGTPAEILEKVVNDREVTAWCRARRIHFEGVDRQRRGLAPRARPVTPEASPVSIPEMPIEGGETDAAPGRAYRAYR